MNIKRVWTFQQLNIPPNNFLFKRKTLVFTRHTKYYNSFHGCTEFQSFQKLLCRFGTFQINFTLLENIINDVLFTILITEDCDE